MSDQKTRLRRPVKGVVLGALLAAGLSHARAAYAHGAIIDVTPTAVEVKATFDDGEPMAEAQVLIYSPSDLKTPWQKGQTNADGTYSFAPDAETPGAWEVTVRKAGHGGTTTFLVEGGGATVNAATAAAPVQKWLSMAAIVWGFVGTALFFSRQPSGVSSGTQAAQKDRSLASQPASAQPEPALNRSVAESVSVSSAARGQR